jgi:hypothetical protein
VRPRSHDGLTWLTFGGESAGWLEVLPCVPLPCAGFGSDGRLDLARIAEDLVDVSVHLPVIADLALPG